MPPLALLALAASTGAAISLWRLACEGFGCTGVGIAWIAWAALLYLPALLLAALTRHLLPPATGLAVLLRLSLGAHLLLGAVLLGYWAWHQLAR